MRQFQINQATVIEEYGRALFPDNDYIATHLLTIDLL